MILEELSVLHRTGQWCAGVRTASGVIAYDVPILPQYQAPGRPTTDRCFVLPDEGVQLTKPNTFTGSYEGGWYIDLIEVQHFIDCHLRTPDEAAPTAWPDFPPDALLPLLDLPPFAAG